MTALLYIIGALAAVGGIVLAGSKLAPAGTVTALENAIFRVTGIDVSHNNGAVSWPSVAAAGVNYAFIKAAEGTDFTDPAFHANFNGAVSNGVKAYPYFFYHPEDDGAAQAQFFLTTIGSYRGIVGVDLEETSGQIWANAPDGVENRLRQFLNVLVAAGCSPVIYCNKSFILEFLPDATFLGQYPLWLAHWSSDVPTSQIIPPFWSVVAYWQNSSNGSIPGIAGNVDTNSTREA